MEEEKTCEAKTRKELMEFLNNPNIPKTEAEHFARKEISKFQKLLKKLAAYADTSWYQGSPPKSDTATFYYRMRAIEKNIEKALEGGD